MHAWNIALQHLIQQNTAGCTPNSESSMPIKYRSKVGRKSLISIILGVIVLFQFNFCLKNGSCSLYFENIAVKDSYFMHKYKIIDYRSYSIFSIINYYQSYGPFST